MSEKAIFEDSNLRIEVMIESNEIVVKWFGKSDQRNPIKFVVPILLDVLKQGINLNKQIIWNFKELEYMNSSGITPIIKGLDFAKSSQNKVKIVYNKSKKWQDLSFSALRIFQTKDGRIEVIGD